MSKKLYEMISEIMSIPIQNITDDSGPENMENWDSFNALLLVDELESEFKIKFELEEIIDVTTISDIKRHLKNHGVILDD